MDSSDVTIIIPTLNEGGNIGKVIRDLKQLYNQAKIYVADDGSSDLTQVIAKKEGAIVIDRTNRKVKGITASVVEALQQATTEKIIVMDGDLQHPPEKVQEMIRTLDNADMVIAVREKVIGPWGIFRRLESKAATELIKMRLRKNIHDPLSGFFGFRKKLLSNLKTEEFEMRCFKILFNILKNIDLQKTTLAYVYYDFDIRKNGESKLGTRQVYYFIKNLLT